MKRGRGNPNIRCSICVHEQRHRIELALVSGASRQAVARKFGVSPHAAWRHSVNHVTPERRAQLIAGPLKLHELAERATEAELTLQQYLGMLRSSLFEQYLQAVEVGDRPGFSLIAGRLAEVLRLEGQVNGEISKATSIITNNVAILSSPLLADLRSMLLERLASFPEARAAVVAGLRELAARAAPGTAEPVRPALEHEP
jgi:transposase-like protein